MALISLWQIGQSQKCTNHINWWQTYRKTLGAKRQKKQLYEQLVWSSYGIIVVSSNAQWYTSECWECSSNTSATSGGHWYFWRRLAMLSNHGKQSIPLYRIQILELLDGVYMFIVNFCCMIRLWLFPKINKIVDDIFGPTLWHYLATVWDCLTWAIIITI